MLTNIIQYTNPSNFTFNNSLVSFPGANTQLLNIRPPNSTFYQGFHVNANGEYGNGVLTGTPHGAPIISGNQCNFAGGLNYIDYSATLNADSAQTGTIRFDYIPNYNGVPGSYQVPISITKTSGSLLNLIEIYHDIVTGGWTAGVYDQTGANIAIMNFGTFNAVSGTLYEIEFDYDLTGGNNRLFVNGVQPGGTVVAFGTRSSVNIGLLRLGTDFGLNYTANFALTNVIIFNTVQHVANFPSEIPRQPETIYSTQDPTILTNASQAMNSLQGFIESAIKPANTSIQYIMVVNGQPMWWNGAAWVLSNGTFAQSNLATDINTNALSLVTVPSNVQVIALLNSILGNATPILSQIQENYTYAAPAPTQPPQCFVYAFLEDILGDLVVSNAQLVAELPVGISLSGYVVAAFKTSIPFNNLGYAQLQLVSTNTLNQAYNFSITYTDSFNTQRTILFASAVVPTQLSIALTALTTIVNA